MKTTLFPLLRLLLPLFILAFAEPTFALNMGDIITVAGIGAGDNIPATSAILNYPASVTVDNAGNFYIADRNNNRISKVAVGTGIITTIAGNGAADFSGDYGDATSASLNYPSGVAVDSNGNLYIADSGNNRIRKVAVGTGIITTVAGNGAADYTGDSGDATSASLNGPNGVAVDNAGNLFIADSSNNLIRKVTTGTGIITTVAGNGAADFSGDSGDAVSATLNYPSSVTIDSVGNLYIADQNNSRIRKVTASSGIITTVAGNGNSEYSGDNGDATSAGLNGPVGVALDSDGNIYIADQENHRIRKVAAGTGTITTVAGNGNGEFFGDNGYAISAGLNEPACVALDSNGNLFIADSYNNRLRKVESITGIITTVAGKGIDALAGDNGTAILANFIGPNSVAIDSAGNIYIADYGNNRIRKVAAETGIVITVAGNGNAGYSGDDVEAASASLNHPTGVALDFAGNIYIADFDNNRIRKVDAATGFITTVAGNGNSEFSGDNGAATSAGLNAPYGLTLDSAGNIYVADYRNNRIRKVASGTGIITTVAGNGNGEFSGDNGDATSAGLNSPTGVVLDSAENIYIADSSNNRIRKVVAVTGTITTVAGNGTAGFSGDNASATSANLNYPTGVVVDSDGNFYITDYGNQRIRKVSIATGFITAVAGNGTAGYSGDNGPATSASLYDPVGSALDSAGNLYIADSSNNRIRKVYLFEPLPATLTVHLAGTGSGSVNSITPGVSFTCIPGACQAQSFPNNTTITLAISPTPTSLFKGWSGACTNNSGDCLISMVADRSVTAIFNSMPPLMISGTPSNYYDTFAVALDDKNVMPDNSSVTLYGQAVIITGGFTLNRPVNLTIEGGFDAGFQSNSNEGNTVIVGGINVGNGSLRVKHLVLKKSENVLVE